MQNLNNSLPGRILTVILATLTMAGLAYLVFFANRGIVPAVLEWVLVGALGLAAGFVARFLLPRRTFLLRFLSALLGVQAGFVFLGLVSGGTMGTLLPARDQDGLNLAWIGQFALAGLTAWLSLSAWKISPQSKFIPKAKSRIGRKVRSVKPGPPKKKPGRPAKVRPLPRTIRANASRSNAARAHRPRSQTPRQGMAPLVQREYWEERWKQLQGRLRHWWEHGIEQHSITPPRLPRAKRPALPLQAKRTRRKPRSTAALPVRLIGREEHRCPFCLDEVEDNDPRGVKVCPICHTYHHADCWAVTGTCQVPHYHE